MLGWFEVDNCWESHRLDIKTDDATIAIYPFISTVHRIQSASVTMPKVFTFLYRKFIVQMKVIEISSIKLNYFLQSFHYVY